MRFNLDHHFLPNSCKYLRINSNMILNKNNLIITTKKLNRNMNIKKLIFFLLNIDVSKYLFKNLNFVNMVVTKFHV
jgi:hypothetical protein